MLSRLRGREGNAHIILVQENYSVVGRGMDKKEIHTSEYEGKGTSF